jgi:hypothetical protein
MRNILEAVIVGIMIVSVAWSGAIPADGSDGQERGESRSLTIGLDLRVDADWIWLNGTWSLNRRGTDARIETQGETHEVRLGAFPNVVRRAQKGIVLFRVLRCTTVCVAKQWIRDHSTHDRNIEEN